MPKDIENTLFLASKARLTSPPPDYLIATNPQEHFGIPPERANHNGHMPEGVRRFRLNKLGVRLNVGHMSQELRDALVRHGKSFLSISSPNNPDGVFVADPVLAFVNDAGEKIALMSNMKYRARDNEVVIASAALRAEGFLIHASDCFFESSGDSLFDPNYGTWIIGAGLRNAPFAGKKLHELSGRPVIEMPTFDNEFYHKDTFFSPMPGGHITRYTGAMTSQTVQALNILYPNPDQRLDLDHRDAIKLAANLQFIAAANEHGGRKHILLAPKDCSEKILARFEGWGYGIKGISIWGVRGAGGGIHCSLQQVWRMKEYPFRGFPKGFFDTIVKLNSHQPERRCIRVWHDGKLVS